eukprot:SAG31_NODE_393_length_16293_cov_15.804372_15_plen_136_part_00
MQAMVLVHRVPCMIPIMQGLPFSEFLMLCVLISCKHLEPSRSYNERFEMFVSRHVVPFTQPSNSQLFNQLVEQPKVRGYFDRKGAAFRRIYQLFAAADDDDDDNLTIMNLKEFVTYVSRICCLMKASLMVKFENH